MSEEFGESRERKLEMGQANWPTLRPHFERDAVIVVSDEKDLKEVAEVIAADDTAIVSEWIENGTLSKPSAEQVAEWGENLTKEFECAIVQPFVLMKIS